MGSLFNDKATSAIVTPGEIWVLYEHSSFRGRYFAVIGNVPNVGVASMTKLLRFVALDNLSVVNIASASGDIQRVAEFIVRNFR